MKSNVNEVASADPGVLWLIVTSAAVAIILDWTAGRDRVAAPDPRVDKFNALAVQRAHASLPALFSSVDFPLASLRREEHETVAFAFAVDGKRQGCSGSKDDRHSLEFRRVPLAARFEYEVNRCTVI